MFYISQHCRHRCELPKLFAERGYKVGVEVGVLQAAYSSSLLNSWPGFLHLVDPWAEDPDYRFGGLVDNASPAVQDHAYNFRWAKAVLKTYPEDRYKIWRTKSSHELADRIGKVDFAYIDGNHTFEYVIEDLRVWWDHIKPGGVLAGHDLFQVNYPGLTEAVILFAREVQRDIYIVLGKDGCPCGEGGVPSYYLEKGK